MSKNKLLEHAKMLHLADERELLSKVTIASPLLKRLLRSLFNRKQTIGRAGFLGLYQTEIVCYDSNMWNTIPGREIFRIPSEDVIETIIKMGFLGFRNRLIIKTTKRKYKLYFRSSYHDLIREIKNTIKKE
jgi:hypothetical protein